VSDFLKQFESDNYHSDVSADKPAPSEQLEMQPVSEVPDLAPELPVVEAVAPEPAPSVPVAPSFTPESTPGYPPEPLMPPIAAQQPAQAMQAPEFVPMTPLTPPEPIPADHDQTQHPQVPPVGYVPARIYTPAAYETPAEDMQEEVSVDAPEETSLAVAPAAPSNPKAAIARTEDVTKKDTGYDKKKIVLYATLAAAVIAFCALAFGIFFFTQQVEVRDFTGSNISEARTWGIQNRITIEAREVYSLEYDADIVISQNREANTRINRGSVLVLEVSRGPDMTEHIELPDFNTMTTPEVREWRQTVRALNANIIEEYNDDVEAGQFIRYEFTDSAMTRQTYTRADGLLIYMSRGAQTFEANITVPDFFDRALEEVQQWARENSIELTVEEASHATVMEGSVTEQSVAAGQRVAQRSEFSITVSLGISVIVPNFADMSSEEAGMYPGLEVIVQRRYSTSVRFGSLISQSVRAGEELIGEGQRVTVVYSLGRPYMDNLIGDSESTLAEYFYNFRAHGANINYSVVHVSSHEPRGTIIWMSSYGQHISMNATIHFNISLGDLRPPAE